MSTDLLSIGMTFDKWQDAVEAAIATDKLAVTGEVRGGQLIQYADDSGAQINILAVEPFATFAGFDSVTQSFAHISMVNDVLALCEIVDYNGQEVTTVACNLAQGPLLVDEPEQRWQQLGLSALAFDVITYPTIADFEQASPEILGTVVSEGALTVMSGNGTAAPDAFATFNVRVLSAEYRTNTLTGSRFIHATVDGPFPFDVCLPDAASLPERDSVISGKAVLVGSVSVPDSGGCGSGGGGCGSGGCGCGGH
ncbi:hypothetical protein LJU02_06355 [Corynebacterium pseudotuberculosis]|uniref:Uncharacterized protein n=1 Tax=Corynebacterium pseudotuberculosis 258 TaxID=1168865 RepID=A0AAU8PR21_CORPS|nr:hypothetical protein [Corynebacterium pseudotuberculosis]AER69284.1 Hypothetical protein Cp106_1219 [Corynebacterium pseudotuberculosis 1/06-A]AEQ06792.1 hypothetical protein CPCIP5297_06445 [Corynebacterium pseudotuberculosis CIP 52.97]AFB72596.1 hypothetical protein CP316_06430 [Corynebacterium pseudotuberculosis 316]AFK16887.1 hypothetical protein CP258_06445 [Corynebacterium pseudotuberculosis 258]AKS13580.1 Hypothetical protein CpE19_1242 [Corynebacterium pseudotuberculosis]